MVTFYPSSFSRMRRHGCWCSAPSARSDICMAGWNAGCSAARFGSSPGGRAGPRPDIPAVILWSAVRSCGPGRTGEISSADCCSPFLLRNCRKIIPAVRLELFCGNSLLRYPRPAGSRPNCMAAVRTAVPDFGIKAFSWADSNRRLDCLTIMLCTLPTELPFARKGVEPSTPQILLNLQVKNLQEQSLLQKSNFHGTAVVSEALPNRYGLFMI